MERGEGTFKSSPVANVDIEIDIQAIVNAIVKNPAAMRKLSEAVRIELTRKARNMGNLFGQWAQGR
jgi:hypothetical protein